MKSVLKELYGAGILFFYYTKYFILIGWPILRFGLDYKDNIYIDMLWLYCLLLMIKDIVYRFVLKKRYCDAQKCQNDENE